MASSLPGIVHGDYLGRLLANYRSSPVAWDGEPFTEPSPTAAGSAPADWIVPRVIRTESRRMTDENAQRQDARIGVWIAFQSGRGGKHLRRDAILADLEDAFSLARSSGQNAMLGQIATVPAEAPPRLTLSHPWEWEAAFFDAVYTEQPT